MIQRSFIRKIDDMRHLDYWTQLKKLHLYSLERRRERYIMIYIWRILEGQVPDLTSGKIYSINEVADLDGNVVHLPSKVIPPQKSKTSDTQVFQLRPSAV